MNKIFQTFFLILISFQSFAQHDFDSLYKSNNDFKTYIKGIADSYDFFSDTSVLEITFVSDFKGLIKNKYDREYQDAKIILSFNDTVQINRNVQIKSRGNYRLSSCYFPPLKLNFKKEDVKLKQIKEFDKMKIVNNCKYSKSYEQYILLERLIYESYQLLTPMSFRTRLLKINYLDENDKVKPRSLYGFLIEPEDQLADRLNGLMIEPKNVTSRNVNPMSENMMAVFNYMIGNTDYAIPAMHNIKIFKSNDPTQYRPEVVPYDFDYAGLVDAPYAIPHEALGIENVKERLYRGICHDDVIFKNTYEIFLKNKDAIINLFESSELITKQNKSRVLFYIKEFYSIIENENRAKNNIQKNCLN